MKVCKGWKNFVLRTTLWKCHLFMLKLKSESQKLNFVMAKALSKIYTLDCSCKYLSTSPHNCI